MNWFLQIQNVKMIVSDLSQLKRADYDFVHGSSGLRGFFPDILRTLKLNCKVYNGNKIPGFNVNFGTT